MISRDELEAQVEAMQITLANVERDYVFGWLISGFYAESHMAEALTLKGGNALRKGYLPASRFSDDLDFSCATDLDGDRLLAAFNESCRYAAARSGVAFDLGRNRVVDYHEVERGKSVYKLALYFRDFSGDARPVDIKVRVDVTEFDRLHLPVRSRNLIHQYSDAAEVSVPIRVVALEEALADKLRCLLQRRYAYDLFDLVYGTFISKDLAIDRTALMRTFLAKSIFAPDPQAAKQLLLTAPWESLRGFWGKVVTPAASRFGFDDAVQALRVGLEDLFAGLGGRTRAAGAYFPEPVRSQIFHAGAQQRLMRMRYHGASRIIEPYALKFMRRTDGFAREYLWAYDRTGGRSGPGLKSFVASDLAAIEVLEAEFLPRFPVELMKGTAGSGTFEGRAGTLARGVRPSSVRTRAYTVQCPYCNRRFSRTTMNTALRAHQDGYGNKCYGKRGYLV